MAVGDSYVSSYKFVRERYSSSSDMTTMRIAVAGTGGLAVLIAGTIAEETSHHVVFLSREETHRQVLTAAGFQVAVVDYTNGNSLAFALRGIDTVISTIGGSNQIALIHAAVQVRVRRFVPSEFEGVPQLQATTSSDRFRLAARTWLHSYRDRIQSTIFVCGIFYERFQPGGLQASRIGYSSGINRQGDYLVDCENMTATVVTVDSNGAHVSVCMTTARDVARFVTRALDMPNWPSQLFMYGQRITVHDLVQRIRTLRGRQYSQFQYLTPHQIQQYLHDATSQRDQCRFRAMLNTAQGHYDYSSAPHSSLNALFPDVTITNFDDWFRAAWAGR